MVKKGNKMSANEFVKNYYPFALEVEKETGIPALAIMAQAALESGWGKYAIGNNFFGIKYSGKGLFKEVTTTEYHPRNDKWKDKWTKEPEFIPALNKYKYRIKTKFQDYETVKDAFKAHALLLMSIRYQPALKYKNDPVNYLKAVWKCGYATDPNYGDKMEAMINSVKRRINK